MFGVLFNSQRDRRRRRLQAIVIEEVAAHILKKMNELLTYQEVVIWRRENGFDRVAEGEESCFPVHCSLPPTPQEYYASLWCEVNALKEAISMPAKTPWQKTIEFVDGLKGKLPDWELAEIKRYVEKRCREETEEQMTVTPVDTVQYCSPISQTPEPPLDAYVMLENNERKMDSELEKLKSSSAGTGLNTPGQQCPPNEGIRETGRTTASGILAAGAGSSKKRNISTSTGTAAGISLTAATPGHRRLKTFSEQDKQFDLGGQREKAPPWDAAVTLPFFFGGELGSSLLFSVCILCSGLSVCLFSKLLIYPGETYQQAERRGSWTRIESLKHATGGQAFSRLLPF